MGPQPQLQGERAEWRRGRVGGLGQHAVVGRDEESPVGQPGNEPGTAGGLAVGPQQRLHHLRCPALFVAAPPKPRKRPPDAIGIALQSVVAGARRARLQARWRAREAGVGPAHVAQVQPLALRQHVEGAIGYVGLVSDFGYGHGPAAAGVQAVGRVEGVEAIAAEEPLRRGAQHRQQWVPGLNAAAHCAVGGQVVEHGLVGGHPYPVARGFGRKIEARTGHPPHRKQRLLRPGRRKQQHGPSPAPHPHAARARVVQQGIHFGALVGGQGQRHGLQEASGGLKPAQARFGTYPEGTGAVEGQDRHPLYSRTWPLAHQVLQGHGLVAVVAVYALVGGHPPKPRGIGRHLLNQKGAQHGVALPAGAFARTGPRAAGSQQQAQQPAQGSEANAPRRRHW